MMIIKKEYRSKVARGRKEKEEKEKLGKKGEKIKKRKRSKEKRKIRKDEKNASAVSNKYSKAKFSHNSFPSPHYLHFPLYTET